MLIIIFLTFLKKDWQSGCGQQFIVWWTFLPDCPVDCIVKSISNLFILLLRASQLPPFELGVPGIDIENIDCLFPVISIPRNADFDYFSKIGCHVVRRLPSKDFVRIPGFSSEFMMHFLIASMFFIFFLPKTMQISEKGQFEQ